MRRDTLRRVRLSPYRKGAGPTFALTLWDTGSRHARGTTMIGYRLTQREPGRAPIVLFEGGDFSPSPCYADDSDQTVAGLLGFLTLRPGDTDPEYFDRYTDVQRAFCAQHAESLSMEAIDRFGED